jgi:AcrR family transcriptional regulator
MARARTRPTRQDTIDLLIDGARRAFVERGFYGASIEDICASAGLTRGAFYSAFGKKEDLFFALYDRLISDVSELFIAGLDRAAHDHLDPIDALFEALAEHFPIGREWYVLNAEFTLFAIRDVDAARNLALRRHALRAVIMDKLDVALTRSGRKAVVSPELFARAVIGLADAGLGQSLIEPDALGSTTLLRTFMAPLVRSLSVPVDSDSSHDAPQLADAGQARPGTDGNDDARRRLLNAARTAFLRDGYGKARLSDIAATAGISKKTIYTYAPSKAALFATVAREAIDHAVGDDRQEPGATGDLADTLRACLIGYARRCFSEAGIQAYALIMSEARQFPDLVQAYLAATSNITSAQVAGLLRAAADQGMQIAGSPDSAANMLIEMAVGEPLRQAALHAGPRLQESAIERRVDEGIAVFLNGTSEIRHAMQPVTAA